MYYQSNQLNGPIQNPVTTKKLYGEPDPYKYDDGTYCL